MERERINDVIERMLEVDKEKTRKGYTREMLHEHHTYKEQEYNNMRQSLDLTTCKYEHADLYFVAHGVMQTLYNN